MTGFGQEFIVSDALARLEGRIPDEDFHVKADIEQRVWLNRDLLERFGVMPLLPAQPEPPD